MANGLNDKCPYCGSEKVIKEGAMTNGTQEFTCPNKECPCTTKTKLTQIAMEKAYESYDLKEALKFMNKD